MAESSPTEIEKDRAEAMEVEQGLGGEEEDVEEGEENGQLGQEKESYKEKLRRKNLPSKRIKS